MAMRLSNGGPFCLAGSIYINKIDTNGLLNYNSLLEVS